MKAGPIELVSQMLYVSLHYQKVNFITFKAELVRSIFSIPPYMSMETLLALYIKINTFDNVKPASLKYSSVSIFIYWLCWNYQKKLNKHISLKAWNKSKKYYSNTVSVSIYREYCMCVRFHYACEFFLLKNQTKQIQHA